MMNTSCLWDVLDTETTSLDETKFLNEYQPHSSLYQLESCVRVTPRNLSGDVGQVKLCSLSDTLAVAVEHQLMLFGTTDWQIISTLNFESVIDCVACTGDGSLLVVGDRSGKVHAVNAVTGDGFMSRQLVSSQTDGDDRPLFKLVEFGGGELSRLALLTTSGQLHIIDGLSTLQLEHSVIDLTDAEVSCLTVLSNGDIITCNSDNSLSYWSAHDQRTFTLINSCSPLLGSAVKCNSLPCGNYVIVLDSSGRLVLWNIPRFVAISMLDCSDVVDFVLIDRPADSEHGIGTIATLQNSNIAGRISIYSFPCTDLIYSADVHQGALLFSSLVFSECVYVLEPRGESSSWQVRRLSETNPQTRLRRLLAKQRFSEAESFAEKFDLDMQFVYRECVLYLTSKLSASANDVADVTELISQLMKCLGRLNDVAFVIECCITTALPELAATNQLLSLAYERLSKSRSQLSAELYRSLNSHLEMTARRLAAFQVHRYFHSSCHCCYYFVLL